MASMKSPLGSVLAMVTLLAMSLAGSANAFEQRKAYVVLVGSVWPYANPQSYYINILNKVLEGSSPREVLVSTFTDIFDGFVARLTTREAEKLSSMEGVTVISNRIILHALNRFL